MKKNNIKINIYLIILVLLFISLTTYSFAQDDITKTVIKDSLVNNQINKALNISANITTNVASNLIEISWDSVQDALGYEVKITDSDSIEVVVDAGANTTYTHNRLEPSSTYKYSIRAKNADGYSPWSSEIIATTSVKDYILDCKNDETYNILIKAIDNSNLVGNVYTLTYDEEALEIDDLYIMTWEKEKNIGEIPGKISFCVANPIEAGKCWTGLIYGVKFKSKINGITKVSLAVD